MVPCELCERVVPTVTVHHLVPKQVARRRGVPLDSLPTAHLCAACHRQLHVLFDNRRLAEALADIPSLREDASVQRFLHWVRKQPPERKVRVRRRGPG